MKLKKSEQQRLELMKAVALEVSDKEEAVLKGGTALLLTRGLDRFSEDLDFDLPKGTSADFRRHIMKAAQGLNLDVDHINIKKDTDTTKRYMVHFPPGSPNENYPLRIECSMRGDTDKEDIETVHGIKTYTVSRIAALKTEAFVKRNKARDTYDIAFLTERYPDQIREETWERIKKHVAEKGIGDLCGVFEEEQKKDRLLSKFDATEIVLKLDENIRRHEELSHSGERSFEREQERSIPTSADPRPAPEGPNMAEVQSAESKASLIEGMRKSADGNTLFAGRDIDYTEEGYVAAATQVKYEAQRARTADNEIKSGGSEPQIGDRVTFQARGSEVKLTGSVVAKDDRTVTLRCGRRDIPTVRDKGGYTPTPPLPKEHTKEFAKEQAQKLVGEKGRVFFARQQGAWKGEIIGKTPTFAIQKVNGETAVLHRLKDLDSKEKDSRGLLKEGAEVSIVKDANGVSITPWEKERGEREKVRERQKSRGGQSR